MNEIDHKVKRMLADVLQMPANKIVDDLTMQDVDAWDSLRHMELIVALEQAFSVELTFDEIVTMKGVREIKRVLAQRSIV